MIRYRSWQPLHSRTGSFSEVANNGTQKTVKYSLGTASKNLVEALHLAHGLVTWRPPGLGTYLCFVPTTIHMDAPTEVTSQLDRPQFRTPVCVPHVASVLRER